MESADTLDRVRAVGLALLVAGVAIAVGVGLTAGVAGVLLATDVRLGLAGRIVLTLVLVQGVAFGGVSLAFLTVTARGWSFLDLDVPDPRDLLVTAGGYVLTFAGVFAAAMAATGLSTLFGIDTGAHNQIVEIGVESPAILLVLVPMAFLFIGPGEELLFRGVVQGLLRERFEAPAAIALASAIFAGIHYLALVGSTSGRITAVLVLFVPSLVLGGLYEYTENLVVPALVHAAYDATLFLGLYALIRADMLEDLQSMTLLVG